MTLPPIFCTWEGDSFKPFPRFAKLCDKEFVVGENYKIEVIEERSMKSHRHYFAQLNQLWMSMPEDIAEQFPTVEHMRKRALIDAGFYNEEIIDCGSNRVAINVAASIRKHDDFALIIVRDQYVVERRAKSQSQKAMGKQAFQDSKDKVIGVLSDLVGVQPDNVPAEGQV